MPIKIAINGFGRIGRSVFRRLLAKKSQLKVIAINDLTDNDTLAHLLEFDSLYGRYKGKISFDKETIKVDGESIKIFAEKDPLNLPWKKLGIDIVLECTGLFTDKEGANKHIISGAKKVIISAPPKSSEVPSFVLGVNEERYDFKKDNIVSMASCTTNCIAPVVKVLNDNFGVLRGFMTTIHSYTNDQRILDLPHKDKRRARAAAVNIIPTSTGAAKSIGSIIPELEGKLNGIAIRVPTPVVSAIDLVVELNKNARISEINSSFKKASLSKKMKGILKVEDKELVSSDYIGSDYSAIVDMPLTMTEGNLAKIIAWYDNEWGYSCRLADFAKFVSKKM